VASFRIDEQDIDRASDVCGNIRNFYFDNAACIFGVVSSPEGVRPIFGLSESGLVISEEESSAAAGLPRTISYTRVNGYWVSFGIIRFAKRYECHFCGLVLYAKHRYGQYIACYTNRLCVFFGRQATSLELYSSQEFGGDFATDFVYLL